ncbi:MAG: hypothetical protein ACXWAS_14475 [Methylobacter sp.]
MIRKSPLAPLLQRGEPVAIVKLGTKLPRRLPFSKRELVTIPELGIKPPSRLPFTKKEPVTIPELGIKFLRRAFFAKKVLRARLAGDGSAFLFQAQRQHRTVSIFSEKTSQQESGNILEKNATPASPFVKGGLRGICRSSVLCNLNEVLAA